MTVVELQDIADNVRAVYYCGQWHFTAVLFKDCKPVATAEARDPDFLIAATKLIVETQRMREAAR